MTEIETIGTGGCGFPAAAIHDLHDGLLDAAAGRRAEEHLAACADCRSLLAELEDLRRAADALSRTIEPARDLWPAIETRLGRRPAAPVRRVSRRLGQLAAAIALILFGALLSRVLPPPGTAPEKSAAGPAGAGAPALTTAADQALAVTDYRRARAALMETVERRRGELEPTTLVVVERNLQIIDQAIRELERALATDPGNPRLSTLLLASYQQEIDLLQRLTTEPS